MDKIITYSFCEPFIDNLIEYIDKNYIKKDKDISRLGIVFGGKRPSLFIKRALAKKMGTCFYTPQFFSIDEFVHYIVSQYQSFGAAQDLDNCYMLYNLTKDVAPELLAGRETFAEFLPWTREIIRFIDMLDLENVKDKALLNIKDNAEIGYDVPEEINGLLQHIVKIRKTYHEKISETKTYSRGYQYLKAADVVGKVSFEQFVQILFCNFFYFNRSEEQIVKNLYDRNLATLIFQGDRRKWPVLERISQNMDCNIVEGEKYKSPTFNLNLYSGFDVHSQVGHIREILKTIKEKDKTVIVLPNPNHIIPLLSEMTSIIEDFNISMGYPLKRSSLYSLFKFIFKAQLSKKHGRYYAKDYLKVIRHPFIKNLKLGKNQTVTRILVHKIEEILTGKEETSISGSLFIELEDILALDELYMMTEGICDRLSIETGRRELQEILKTIHQYLFSAFEKVDTFQSFAAVLGDLLDLLVKYSFMKNYPLNINIANKMYLIRDEFEHAGFNNEQFTQEDIFRIFDGKVTREVVAFHGSPLKGLQMLGLFETRSLNFDHVIVMDVNEGTLPNLNIYEPLIPREVMISLNLDRLELEEEIQRYQFMRLISSAKNVHLVYQESKEKEKSRFIEELIWEEQKKKSSIQTIPVTQANFKVDVTADVKHIKKTPEIIDFLKNHTYSASSINTYLKDPIEFYYNYVLGLRETEDLLDEPDARHIGTFVHELLEEAYNPYLNKKPVINKTFRNRFERVFEQRFEHSFGRSMKSDAFLIKSVLKERLARFLDNEEQNPERKVDKLLFLEHHCSEELKLSCGKIRFRYIIDRIDRMHNGTIMIIDYKTGALDQMPKSIDMIANMELSRESIFENIRSFQVPLYFHYLDQQFKNKPVNVSLYNLRTLKITKFLDTKTLDRREQINEAYLKALDFVVSEILDPEVDFVTVE